MRRPPIATPSPLACAGAATATSTSPWARSISCRRTCNGARPPSARPSERADIFVFEVPQSEKTIAQLAAVDRRQGISPPASRCASGCAPALRSDYDTALAASGLPSAGRGSHAPLAGRVCRSCSRRSLNRISPPTTAWTNRWLPKPPKTGKPIRYLETIEEQLALWRPTTAPWRWKNSKPA